MNSTVTAPAVGQIVKAIDVPGMPEYNGQIVTITEVVHDGRVYAEFKSTSKPDDTERLYFYEWLPADEPSVDIAMIPVSDHDRTVENLNAQISRLNERVNTYASDFAIVGDMLKEEAERRGWCGEYDEFVERVNSRTARLELPTREEEYEVTVTVTGTMTHETTVSVMARSQEDANTMVDENMDDYVDADDVLTSAARNRSFDDIECEVS